MARAGKKASYGLVWRHQSVPEEWSVRRDLADLILKVKVAGVVSERQGGVCCYPDCGQPIGSYPHAIPWPDGADDEINRVGVCRVHSEAMRAGRDPDGVQRQLLQDWLKRYYAETAGLAPEVWEAIARGRPPADLEVAGSC